MRFCLLQTKACYCDTTNRQPWPRCDALLHLDLIAAGAQVGRKHAQGCCSPAQCSTAWLSSFTHRWGQIRRPDVITACNQLAVAAENESQTAAP